jgi:uncharacterized protein (TIGR03663 family)
MAKARKLEKKKKRTTAEAETTRPRPEARPRPPARWNQWAEKHYRWIFVVLLLITVFTRFYNLQTKVFHHDESLYAKYIWDYAEGRGHRYDPLMHGPFLFITNGWLMKLIGDSDYKVRTYPAIYGVALVAFTHFLRPILGASGTLLAALWFALSPHYVYYSRFLRMDIFVVVFTYMVVIGVLRYMLGKKWRWMIFATFGLALLYCTKENSFLHTFEFVSFLALRELYLLARGWRARRGVERIAMVDEEITYAWEQRSRWEIFKERLAMGGDFLWRTKFRWVLLLGIFFTIFYLFYTTFLTNIPGFIDGLGRKAIPYWKHQNAIRRVRGDYHYYIWRLTMYDLPILIGALAAAAYSFVKRKRNIALALAFTGIVLALGLQFGKKELPAYAIIGDYGHLDNFPQQAAELPGWALLFDKMHMQVWAHPLIFVFTLVIGLWTAMMFIDKGKEAPAFFAYWAMFSLLLYSYLGEKVSWLGIHIYQPMVLLLAWGGYHLFRRSRYVFPGFVALSAIFMVYATYGLNFYKQGINEANPNEIICYTQTHDDIEWILAKIQEAEQISGLGKEIPLSVSGSATWPFSWYLRHYRKWYTPPNTVPSTNSLLVVMDWTQRSKYDYVFADNYVLERKKLRAWQVLPNMSKSTITWGDVFEYFFDRLDPEGGRKPLYPQGVGAYDIAVFIRKDIAEGEYDPQFGRDTRGAEEMQRKAQALKPLRLRPDKVFGSQGAADGQFIRPRDIAVSETHGFLVVADTENHRVQKFDLDGNFLLTIGGSGNGPGQFNQPSGVAIDADGNIYVSDTWNHRIQKFTPDGAFLKAWGQGGCGGDLDFWAPKGIVVTRSGSVFVVNTGCHRINKFTRDGVFVRRIGVMNESEENALVDSFHEPVGIAEGPDGNLYVCDTANHRVQVFDQNLRPVRRFRVWGWDEYYTEPFITFDPAGTLFVSDAYNARIERFTTDGELINVWGYDGSGPGAFKLPKGLAATSSHIYVVDSDNHRIQRFPLDQLPKP